MAESFHTSVRQRAPDAGANISARNDAPHHGVRDFQQVIDRIAALPSRLWQPRVLGEVRGLPVFAVESKPGSLDRTVLLTGGVHGDEPAGGEAALRWLENPPPEAKAYHWLVLPCVNPTGWVHDRRTNSVCRDINRNFRLPGCCGEARLVRAAVANRRFVFVMDFHEDSDAPGYYICEIKRAPPFAGEQVVAAVRPVLPIWKAQRLDGRLAASEGCVRRFPVTLATLDRRRRWPMEFFLLHGHTDHTFCSETPSHRFDLRTRVTAHHLALRAALRFHDKARA
jgi:murein peptide amidase A